MLTAVRLDDDFNKRERLHNFSQQVIVSHHDKMVSDLLVLLSVPSSSVYLHPADVILQMLLSSFVGWWVNWNFFAITWTHGN